jgi:hypothetical protein
MKNKKNLLNYISLGFAFVSTALFIACGGGNTDGTTSLGTNYVSDGAAGSTLKIELEEGGKEIPTGERVKFRVIATDPQGAPLNHIRIFCETEQGIAILEPSRNGVATEHTSARGAMSGVLGGLTEGSFLIECRGPQGFNLIARESYKVVGEAPAGFQGWADAAGGNLGGGVALDPVNGAVTVTQIQFSQLNNRITTTGDIDISYIRDCDGDASTSDGESFTVDNFIASFVNNSLNDISVASVTISLYDGSDLRATSVVGLTGLVIPSGGTSTDLISAFTEVKFPPDFSTIPKSLIGTNTPLLQGTYNTLFEFTYDDGLGNMQTVEQTALVRIGHFNNCGAS